MCKKLICLTSFVVALALAGSAAAQLDPAAVDTGHVYLLEDISGGQVQDDSANSLAGPVVGDPQVVTGIRGNAIQFDGVDDGIDIPDSGFINVNDGPWPNRTIVAMFKCDDVDKPGKQTVFEEGGTTRGMTIYVSEGLVYGAAWNRAEYNWDGAWLTAPVQSGNWYGVAIVIRDGDEAVEDDKFEMWVNGQLVAKAPGGQLHNHGNDNSIGYTNQNNVFHDGNASPADGHYFAGAIDEVWILNVALGQAELSGFAGKVWPFAFGPEPADGALLETTWTSLAWSPGGFAVSHDVYMGTNLEDVNNGVEGTFVGNVASPTQIVGFPGFPVSEGLAPGTTYYWRVDEVNDANSDSPWKGDVWSFWVPPKTAYNAYPPDGAKYVFPDVTLNWTGGFGVKLHNVYFGEDFDEVSSAAGALPLPDPTFTPPALETNKTYYWRVDQFDGAGTNKGDVWSFTTVPDVAAQSTNPNLVGWWRLDEGQYGTALDVSGNNRHGVLVGDPQWIDGAELSALEFDGSDDYVNINDFKGINADATDPDNPVQQPFTVTCWIRTTGNGEMVTWGSSPGRQRLSFRVDGGTLRTEHGSGNLRGNTRVDDGRWHHAALVVTEGAALWTPQTLLYVDGVADSTFSGNDNTYNLTAGEDVSIGRRATSNDRFFPGAIDDVRIYDKALTAEEIAEVMLGDPKLAGSPAPGRDALVDIRDISSLSWSKGSTAASHDVYFGTDKDAMELQGNQTATSLSLADLVEFGGGDYYWRIDEVESDGTVIAGTIWKFTVPDYLIVEDFESYNDINEDEEGSNRVYNTWIDGFGTTTNGAISGNLDPPFMNAGRNSAQAMPLGYDNAGKISEATRTLTDKKDWTVEGVTKLVIWFSGASGNAADRMFVALGNAVVYHPDDAATQDGGWNEWVIDLQEFVNQGLDLTNVGSITLGIGTRGAPDPAGGTGTVEFDDIRLIR